MVRKLSVSIQLTDPEEYEGGELYLYDGDKGTLMDKKQGTLILFPSYVLHEVMPVTKGERNSLVSGVFYINADEKLDKIKFFKEHTYSTISLPTNNYNLFNSTSWWFTVKTGDIVLFPSSLTHMVETKEGDNVRTSLAFNVFVEGKIGNNKDLTELIL